MENPTTCPICFEIPEREIFQCSNGHIICSECAGSLTDCPQCRIPYGRTKIRTRILEDILDGQEYGCNYKANGCKHKCKRREISKHSSSCSYNPDFVPFCKIIGFENCTVGINSSRDEILTHLKTEHDVHFEFGENFKLSHSHFNVHTYDSHSGFYMPVILSLDANKQSPLFLIRGHVNSRPGFMSWSCFRLWNPDNHARTYQFLCSIKNECPADQGSLMKANSSTCSEQNPIIWVMNANTINSTSLLMPTCHIGVPLSVINEKFLSADDCLALRLTVLPKDPESDFPLIPSRYKIPTYKDVKTCYQPNLIGKLKTKKELTKKKEKTGANAVETNKEKIQKEKVIKKSGSKVSLSTSSDVKKEIVANLLRSAGKKVK